MELAVVLDVARAIRQRMHARAGRRSALRQAAGLLHIDEQLCLDRLVGYPAAAGVVMHLLQVRPVAEPPCLRQRARLHAVADELGFVEEP